MSRVASRGERVAWRLLAILVGSFTLWAVGVVVSFAIWGGDDVPHWVNITLAVPAVIAGTVILIFVAVMVVGLWRDAP